MPNIGPVELIIILVIALLILGPGRLPDVGSALGKSIREFRKAATDVQDSVKLDATPAPPAAPPAPAAAAAPAPAAGAAPVAAAVAVPAPNTLAAPATRTPSSRAPPAGVAAEARPWPAEPVVASSETQA
jgi:TatA/E family protein of Tat protein translocase